MWQTLEVKACEPGSGVPSIVGMAVPSPKSQWKPYEGVTELVAEVPQLFTGMGTAVLKQTVNGIQPAA